MSKRAGDAPSLAMVVTGGIGVLVVIAFVWGVALSRDRPAARGDRVAAVEIEEAPGFALLVGRCDDERVRAVELRSAEGAVLWRIESARGGIDRRFVPGHEPFGFATARPFEGLLPGPLAVEVAIDDLVDAQRFDPDDLDDEEAVRAPCEGSDLDLVTILFAIGAVGVVAAYAVMVTRWWGASRS